MIRFTIYGEQRPAGSKRAFPYKRRDGRTGVRVTHDNPNTKSWMADVTAAAVAAYNGPLIDGPVELRVTFYRPRPKSHFGAKGVKPSAPAMPTTKPDLLKLARAIEDALTGVVWRDDAQVCLHLIEKRYGERYATEVTVLEMVPVPKTFPTSVVCKKIEAAYVQPI
jgi:Holliday junction resolvase RusA-like endonuclease